MRGQGEVRGWRSEVSTVADVNRNLKGGDSIAQWLREYYREPHPWFRLGLHNQAKQKRIKSLTPRPRRCHHI